MNVPSDKRLTIGLGAVCVGLLVLSGYLFWSYGELKIRVAFASEQTKIFNEMRTRALQGETADAAGFLEYIVGYYPSGTKQQAGSELDLIVERERAFASKAIIVFLRAKTNEDLGENPEAWIQKYAKK